MKLHQGIDLLKISRIEKIYKNYGEKFLLKIFSDNEIKQIKENPEKEKYKIASKFSAKEATSKAIGSGISDGIRFKDIEILNLENGKPVIYFYGKDLISSSVSISDEDDFVISVVTLLVRN